MAQVETPSSLFVGFSASTTVTGDRLQSLHCSLSVSQSRVKAGRSHSRPRVRRTGVSANRHSAPIQVVSCLKRMRERTLLHTQQEGCSRRRLLSKVPIRTSLRRPDAKQATSTEDGAVDLYVVRDLERASCSYAPAHKRTGQLLF